MKWVAGFETCQVHWNGRCMAEYTGHLPGHLMADNYEWAMRQGFVAARDGLAWNRPVSPRIAVVPEHFPVFWSLHHFGPINFDPRQHVRHVLELFDHLRPGDRPFILPVVEPSVGYGVSGLHPHEAERLALDYMEALRHRAHIITGDPVHRLAEEEWAITDRLVATGQVDIVGVHCYAHHLEVPLSEVISAAQKRYGLPVVLGETGYHDGYPSNEGKPHGCRSREEWKRYVEEEAHAALWACWMPVLPINWEGGEPWPSGWPGGGPAPAASP